MQWPIEQITELCCGMEQTGEILLTKKGKAALPQTIGCLMGKLQATRKGFAFLLAQDGGEDVYIAKEDLGGALHDDIVLVRLLGAGKKSNSMHREGTVFRVIKRARTSVVGTLEKGRYASFVMPEDKRLPEVYIANHDSGNAQHGQLVVAEITRFGTGHPTGEFVQGKVVEVLGEAGTPVADIKGIIRQFEWKESFDAKTLQQAQTVPQAVSKEECEGREDYRDWCTVTIDGADAKDFDDAISLQKTADGYLLGVHIADVTHYVKPGSALDQEAYQRATSVYFPGMVLPMLPEALSNGICSLRQKEDRLTLSCLMALTDKGHVESFSFHKGVIRVHKRVTYEDANAILEQQDGEVAKAYEEVLPLLESLRQLAEMLTQNRTKRGSIDFDIPEPEFVLNEEGKTIDVLQRQRGVANRMVEECMLLANECAAKLAKQQALPFLYRVHEQPDEEKMAAFLTLLRAWGVSFPRNSKKVTPKELQTLLGRTQGHPYQQAVQKIMLRSLKKARYCEENLGHFGLALRHYCHFTSPIRRYPDVVVHRALSAYLEQGWSQKAWEKAEQQMPEYGRHTSERERAGMEAERAVDDLKRAEYMQGKIGEEYQGIISSVTSFGLFVELPNTVEGLLPMAALQDDYYLYDETMMRLVGRHSKRIYTLGQPLRIKVVSVDLTMRRTEFALAAGEEKGGYLPPEKKQKNKDGQPRGQRRRGSKKADSLV